MTGGFHTLGSGGLPRVEEEQSRSALTAGSVKQHWAAWEDSKTRPLLSPLNPPQHPTGALSFCFIQNMASISFVVICFSFGSGFYLSPPALATRWPS